MTKHPNAIVSATAGLGVGTLVVQVGEKLGLHLTAQDGILVAGALGSVALFLGRNGFVGTWRFAKKIVLYGTGSKR